MKSQFSSCAVSDQTHHILCTTLMTIYTPGGLANKRPPLLPIFIILFSGPYIAHLHLVFQCLFDFPSSLLPIEFLLPYQICFIIASSFLLMPKPSYENLYFRFHHHIWYSKHFLFLSVITTPQLSSPYTVSILFIQNF